MKPYYMDRDIARFPIYRLSRGKLIQIYWIKSTKDYNHYYLDLHHFILKQHYEGNEKWYEDRGIKQKLILLPKPIHDQLHDKAIKNLTDKEFEARFGISKWALIFNRKHSIY